MVPFSKANNNGADQTAHLRSLVCAFVIRMQQSHVFFFYLMHNNIIFNECDITGSVSRGLVTGYWSAIEN